LHQRLRLAAGWLAEKDLHRQAKHRRVGADSEDEPKDCAKREGGTAAKRSGGIVKGGDQELATIKKRRTPIITGTLSGTIGRFSKKTDFGGSC
jgi:hypothetical protein